MNYGLRIKDAEGNIIKITPLVSSIVASGIYTSPTALNFDDTYGFDIDLPGTTGIPQSKIAVLCNPISYYYQVYTQYLGLGTPATYIVNHYASSTDTYYDINSTTYAMTQWVAGNCTPGASNTWDPFFYYLPITEWLPISDDGLYTEIRIFPAAGYGFLDASAAATKAVYSLYGLPDTSHGVGISVVSVIIKEWNY